MQSNPVADLLASFLRQVVPLIVGFILTQALRLGITIDSTLATLVVAGVVTTLYYALVRLLETYLHPVWGWLLGYAKAPGYSPTPPPQPAPLVAPNPTPGA